MKILYYVCDKYISNSKNLHNITVALSKIEKQKLTDVLDTAKAFIKDLFASANLQSAVISVQKESGTGMPNIRITPSNAAPSALRNLLGNYRKVLDGCGLPWVASAETKYVVVKVSAVAYNVFMNIFPTKNEERIQQKKKATQQPVTHTVDQVVPQPTVVRNQKMSDKPQVIEWVKYEVVCFLYAEGFVAGNSHISIAENKKGGFSINCTTEEYAISINATFASFGYGEYCEISKRGGKSTKVVALNLPATFVSPLPHPDSKHLRKPKVDRYLVEETQKQEVPATDTKVNDVKVDTPVTEHPQFSADFLESMQRFPSLVDKLADILDNKCLTMRASFQKKLEENFSTVIGEGVIVETLIRVRRSDGNEQVVIINKEKWSELFI